MAKAWLPKVKVAGGSRSQEIATRNRIEVLIDVQLVTSPQSSWTLRQLSPKPSVSSVKPPQTKQISLSSQKLTFPGMPYIERLSTLSTPSADWHPPAIHSGPHSQLQLTTTRSSTASLPKACTSMDPRFVLCSKLVCRTTFGRTSDSMRGQRRVLAVFGTLLY